MTIEATAKGSGGTVPNNTTSNTSNTNTTTAEQSGGSSVMKRPRPPPKPRYPIYGVVAVGPPASGKTTFCDGIQQYTRLLGRDALVVNLDPANERIHTQRVRAATATTTTANNNKQQPQIQDGHEDTDVLPYDTILDVCQEVVNLKSVMEQTGLGPNGGVVYCMEYLEEHMYVSKEVTPNNAELISLY
jgi:hypothetical protein